MPSFYFIKLYDDVLDDHKLGCLPDHLWRRAIEIFLLANRQRNKAIEDEGYLPTASEMAWTLRCTAEEIERDLQDLHDLTNGEGRPIVRNVDGRWHVTRFSHRQEPVSDAERKRRQRERDRVESHGSHDDVTMRDTDIDIETDIEIDIEIEADCAAKDAAVASPHPRNLASISKNLEAKGVGEPKRRRLVALSWVTENLIDDWWRYIDSWPSASREVKLSSLINRLERQRLPPPEYRS